MERLDDLSKEEAVLTPTLPDWVTDIKGVETFGNSQSSLVVTGDFTCKRRARA
jgi:hypothetical protein